MFLWNFKVALINGANIIMAQLLSETSSCPDYGPISSQGIYLSKRQTLCAYMNISEMVCRLSKYLP